MRRIAVTLTSLSMAVLAAAAAGAVEHNPVRTRPPAQATAAVQRIIVKFRSASSQARLQTQAAAGNGEAAGTTSAVTTDRVRALATRSGMSLEAVRSISPNMHVMHVKSLAAGGEPVADMLARLRADPEVEYAVLDKRVYPHAISSDPLATGQWYLHAVQPSAINAEGAWNVTTGSNGVVIAVIDTGVRFDHPDLKRVIQGGRLLPGYDFVSADSAGRFFTANDGTARDADPSDPGDWVTVTEASATDNNCTTDSPSSWHGTRVSGIIGALSNNATGVSGITWSGSILPVRVIGKCGGYNSDVLAGMLWAAGDHVDGVPDNLYPANVLNISLGGAGPCDSASADVTSQLSSRGVLMVVSAGNEGGPVDSPANCPGAAGIAGLRHAGTKVGFSSLGPEIALSAPAGNCVNTTGGPCLFSIDTTSNAGTTTPGASIYTDQFNTNLGTSFSAPIVSGIAGLMLAVNGNLKSTQLIARLKEGATTPFPTTTTDTGTPPVCHIPASATDIQNFECSCTTSTCGAGMANAQGSVNAALRPIAAVSWGSVSSGANVTLQGGSSAAACNHSISTYAWTVVSSTSGSPVIMNANMATATVPAPSSGTTTVRLTVTDETGKSDTADVVIGTTSASSTAPTNAGNTACLAAIVDTQTITVAATDASAAEAGLDAGTFTLTRTGDTSAPVDVVIAMSGTATNGTDYSSIGTTVSFVASQTTATINVTPIDDSTAESSETATLTLQPGAGYDLGTQTSATVTIADNDTAVTPAGNPGGGGGGGGSLDWLTLSAMLLALGAALARGPSALRRERCS